MRKAAILLFLISMPILLLNSEDKESEDEKLTSLKSDRRETLLYGIDSEVKELVAKLKKDKIEGFDKELKEILETTYDDTLKIDILDYFYTVESNSGVDEAIKIFDSIEYEDEYSLKYAQKAISYLSKLKSEEAISRSGDLLGNEKEEIRLSILKLIGENRVKSLEDRLIEILDSDETEDQVYLQTIKTLGQIKSTKSLDNLIEIADDSDEETTVRNAACFSIGEINDPKGIDVLKRCFGDNTNFLLRRSALEALGKFDLEEMDDILIEGLKRDPNWQIRYSAAKSLGERKSEGAIEVLYYKARKDPEAKIKKASIKALGEINSSRSRDLLKEIYLDKDSAESLKIASVEVLIEHNSDWIFPTIKEEYIKVIDEKRKPVMDNAIKFLSKQEFSEAPAFWTELLDSENYLYRIYAIEGIRKNSLSQYKDKLETISKEDKNKNVKKRALSALEEL